MRFLFFFFPPSVFRFSLHLASTSPSIAYRILSFLSFVPCTFVCAPFFFLQKEKKKLPRSTIFFFSSLPSLTSVHIQGTKPNECFV